VIARLPRLGIGLAAVAVSLLCAGEPAKPLDRMTLADGDTIVFLGDSITHQCHYTQYVENYFLTRFPDLRIKFHNAGVSGDRCTNALVRLDQDVIAHKPKYVTILLGMNDGLYQPFTAKTFETYRDDMEKILTRLNAAGAKAILMTPTMFDYRAAAAVEGNRPWPPKDPNYNGLLAFFGSHCRERSMELGLGFVDMYTPLNRITLEQRRVDPKFTLIADAVHPWTDGQAIMAAAVLEDMHPDRQVSAVTIQLGGPKPNGVGRNAQVSEIAHDGDTLSFSVLAKALPWVVPAEARKGYALAKAGHRLSAEPLRVVGLAPGRYRLTIGDAAVGDYSADQLARGVELQANEKTPQFQQAAKVAELNRERNDKAMRPIRDAWLRKRGPAEELARHPNLDAAKKAAFEKVVADEDAKITALTAQLAEFDAKLRAINKPAPLGYRLEKLPNPAGKRKS
jgi:lysophospholipase L1-like esterase